MGVKMGLCFWRSDTDTDTDTDTVPVVTEPAELSRDQLCHELRNALAGIQYERKQIAKSLITIQTHMARIEAALR
jgi:hypothetical protein